MTRAAAVLGAVLVLIGFAGAESAAACSCLGPATESPAARDRDGAIIGRLLRVVEIDPPEDGEVRPSGVPADFVYRVGRVYDRGPGLYRGRRVRVRSNTSGAMCGLPAQRRRLYGLFLTRKNGRWTGNSCATTTPREMRRYFEEKRSGGASAVSPACG